jgi:carboxyl-terminal processing protease
MEIHSSNGAPIRRSSKITWIIVSLVAVCLAFGGGFFLGGRSSSSLGGNIFDGSVTDKPGRVSRGQDVDFNLFWDVWDTVKKEYVDTDKLTEKKLFYGALEGLVHATDDPYSVFMNPEEANEFEQDLAGTFEGIGAEIGFRNEVLTIMAPIEDMPAMKAGVRAGDQIYKINGESTVNFSLEEAIKKIRGPKGTTVTLTLLRAKESKPIDIPIIRDTVVVKSIKTNWLEKEQIFVIKVYNFNDDTRVLFNQAVNDALSKKPKGLVLDLRNNPGGYLDTAVAMASAWVTEGSIVTEQFGDNRKIEHTALGNAPLVDLPTVVLVNQGSASASEIVAGALKDYAKAVLVGEKTFGKGSVQVLRELSDGSVVKVTTAKWLTPKGSYIHEKGIEPDIEIERTPEDRAANKDPQLDRAVQELQKPKK